MTIPGSRQKAVDHVMTVDWKRKDLPLKLELILVNGQVLDINCFEEFRRHHVVATVFADPPECDSLYRSYIRYDAIFQVNVKHFEPTGRKLGFDKSKATPTVETEKLGFDKAD